MTEICKHTKEDQKKIVAFINQLTDYIDDNGQNYILELDLSDGTRLFNSIIDLTQKIMKDVKFRSVFIDNAHPDLAKILRKDDPKVSVERFANINLQDYLMRRVFNFLLDDEFQAHQAAERKKKLN